MPADRNRLEVHVACAGPVGACGHRAGVLTREVPGGRIQTIRSVVNPDKLAHMGPVADVWAIAREVKQARRPRG